MNREKWHTLQSCAAGKPWNMPPVALIVDSPWIPGFTGVSTLDYFSIPDIWLESNLKVEQQFPDILFLPGFWVEMGMAAEPSGFGCKVSFFSKTTPSVHPLFADIQEADRLAEPNPLHDGLMPLILTLYQNLEPRVNDAGHQIKIVAARGPLATAAHIMGVTNFLLGLKLDPTNTHRLLKITSSLVKNWLEAQASVLNEVEGIMVLDDLMGFLSPKDYLEFAHPRFQEIFSAFPDAVKILHNDMDNPVCYPYLHELPVQFFNFSHQVDIQKAHRLVGPEVCLIGNIPPMEVLCKGSPDQVEDLAGETIARMRGSGFILSAGGGVPPGVPGENIQALVSAAQKASAVQ